MTIFLAASVIYTVIFVYFARTAGGQLTEQGNYAIIEQTLHPQQKHDEKENDYVYVYHLS